MTGQLPVFSLKPAIATTIIEETNASASSVIVMIESQNAIRCIEDIAAVHGVDALLVGSNDLAIALGVPADFQAPLFRRALEAVIYDQPDFHHWAKDTLGVRFLLCQQDSGLIAQGAARCAAAAAAL